MRDLEIQMMLCSANFSDAIKQEILEKLPSKDFFILSISAKKFRSDGQNNAA